MDGLISLFRPRAVAVVGASADPAKIGNAILRNMRRSCFPGRIFPVNPKAAGVEGLPCYPDPAALPVVPEVAVVAVAAARESIAAHCRWLDILERLREE